MKKWLIFLLLLAIVLAVVALHSHFVQTLLQAQQSGDATITVTGQDVENMTINISLSHQGTVVIPAGTVFASGDSGTQTMISARTVRVYIGTADQTQSAKLEVYCINRLLDAPTSSSSYTVTEGGEELNPVRRLAAFLEKSSAAHYTRQLAIWLVSENHLDLTADQMRQLLYSHDMQLMDRLSSTDLSTQDLERSFPSIPEEQIEKMRDGVQKAKAQIRDYLQDRTVSHTDIDEMAQTFNLTDDQVRRIKQTLNNGDDITDMLVQSIVTAQFIPSFSKAIDEEINLYKTSARDLLQEYDPELMKSTFFNS
jgi:hydroxymethylpyrimidine pyrophosphatase-like HAD family hydrolase